MESRSRLFYFDVRYKTGGNDKTLRALSQGMAMRERGFYKRRGSEHSGIEEQTAIL